MRAMLMVIWFATAFVIGAGLFAVTRPRPMLDAFVMELKGVGLIERCRQAGACAQLDLAPPPEPRPRETPPADMDRA